MAGSADLTARRERGEQCPRPLSARTINTTIAVLAQVIDAAIEHGWVTTANPARGKRRRLKAEKPRRTWLELDELRALLDAAGEHRALLAVMSLGGLRVGPRSVGQRDLRLAGSTSSTQKRTPVVARSISRPT